MAYLTVQIYNGSRKKGEASRKRVGLTITWGKEEKPAQRKGCPWPPSIKGMQVYVKGGTYGEKKGVEPCPK